MDMKPKPFVFVLMPFSENFNDIYQLGIKAACEKAGVYCERVDEQYFEGSILQRIYNQITKADIVVADLSGKNPNVFYETGYAHALGKHVILLTQNIDDIPFDLKHYTHIIYNQSITHLQCELEKRINWYILNPNNIMNKIEQPLNFHLYDTKLSSDTPIKFTFNHDDLRIFGLQININNPHNVPYDTKISMGLYCKCFRRNNSEHKVVYLSKDEVMHMIPLNVTIYPQGWESVNLRLAGSSLKQLAEQGFMEVWNLRVFYEQGPKDHLVHVEFSDLIEKSIRRKEQQELMSI